MHICIVYKEEYPWDVRVEKIAQTLAAHGYSVAIVARNLNAESIQDSQGAVKIHRLDPLLAWPRSIRALLNARFFLNPLWLAAIFRATRNKSNIVVIVRDLPLVITGWIVARLRGGKVILDMAECYPEMYRSMREFSSGGLSARWARSPGVAELYERIACRIVDKIFVMIEESRDRLLKLGVAASKIAIVSNTPVVANFSGEAKKHQGNQLRICYVGFVTRLRGLDLLLRATKRFLELTGDPESIVVDIVGKGGATDELRSLVTGLGLSQQVTLHGWLDKNHVNELMAQGNVGALTYRVCGHWNHTIPNKIFDYMLAGMPVLATNVLPIRRIIDATGSGVVVDDGDIEGLASAMLMLRDPAIRMERGAAGRRAILSGMNWNRETQNMLKALASLDGLAER